MFQDFAAYWGQGYRSVIAGFGTFSFFVDWWHQQFDIPHLIRCTNLNYNELHFNILNGNPENRSSWKWEKAPNSAAMQTLIFPHNLYIATDANANFTENRTTSLLKKHYYKHTYRWVVPVLFSWQIPIILRYKSIKITWHFCADFCASLRVDLPWKICTSYTRLFSTVPTVIFLLKPSWGCNEAIVKVIDWRNENIQGVPAAANAYFSSFFWCQMWGCLPECLFVENIHSVGVPPGKETKVNFLFYIHPMSSF